MKNRTGINIIGYMLICVPFFGILCSSCAPKFRLPLEENKRPLSLPPKNWGLGLGGGINFYTYEKKIRYSPHFKSNLCNDYVQSPFAIPYIPVGNRFELYILPLYCKYYLSKNIDSTNNTIAIYGLNWALGGGFADMGFLTIIENPNIPLFGYTQLKSPITKNLWLYTTIFTNYFWTPNEYDLHLTAKLSFGLQITPHLYSKMSISPYHQEIKYISVIYNDSLVTDFFIDRGIIFPLLLGYNFTNKWKVYIYNESGITHTKDFTCTIGAGFDFYW